MLRRINVAASAMSFANKRYRIEQEQRHHGREPLVARPAAGNDERLGEILATVTELKRFLDPAQRLATDMIDAYRQEIGEVYQLRA
jgi:chemotaxis protein CheZ